MANGWVEGIVKRNGNPVGGAKVTVDGTSGSYTTGSNGYYIRTLSACSPNPPCGGYTVRAKKTGLPDGVVYGVHITAYTGIWRDIVMG